MARSILRRCPSKTPRSFRSCSVRSRTTERSMAFSVKRWAYSLRPIDASHSATPLMALSIAVAEHNASGWRARPHPAAYDDWGLTLSGDAIDRIAHLQSRGIAHSDCHRVIGESYGWT